MRIGSLFAAFAAVAAFFLVAQVASAQYPSPKTTIVCAVNQIDVKTGGSTAVAATLRDISGEALSGHTVNFKVVSGDATLSSSSATTDGSGTAVTTVHFGASAGAVVIRAISESAECQASTNVQGIVPPATGTAGLLGTPAAEAPTSWTVAAGLAGLLFGAVAFRKTVRA